MKTNGKKPGWMKAPSPVRVITAAGVATVLVVAIAAAFGPGEWEFDPAPPPISAPADDEGKGNVLDAVEETVAAIASKDAAIPPAPETVASEPADVAADAVPEASPALPAEAPHPESTAGSAVVSTSPASAEADERRVRSEARAQELNAGLNAIRAANMERCQKEVDEVRAMFARINEHVPQFADETRSLWVKAKQAQGLATGSAAHREYLADAFAKLLSSEDLNKLVSDIGKRIEKDFATADEALFVRLRIDVPDTSMPRLTLGMERDVIGSAFSRVSAMAASASVKESVVDAGKNVVDGMIAGALSKKITDATGITEQSEGFSFGNLLFSVVLNTAVDQATSRFYDAVMDPIGDLGESIRVELSNIECVLLCGSDGNGGLINQLIDYERRYAEARFRRVEAAYQAER